MPRHPDAPDAQIFLITPRLDAAEPFEADLRAALADKGVACVLVRLTTRDPNAAKKIIGKLAPIIQGADAALLVENNSQLAARVGADGVHCEGFSFALGDVVNSMRPERIVGVGRLETRDDCMTAGEMDVDYLMFGGPDDPATDLDVLGRAQWWAEIFNTPCVAYAHKLDDAGSLVETSAEFIAFEAAVWSHADGPAKAMERARFYCRAGASA